MNRRSYLCLYVYDNSKEFKIGIAGFSIYGTKSEKLRFYLGSSSRNFFSPPNSKCRRGPCRVMSPDPRNRFFFLLLFFLHLFSETLSYSHRGVFHPAAYVVLGLLYRFFLLEFANFYDLLKSTTSSQQWQAAGFILNQKLYDLSLFFLRFYHVSNVP